MQRYNKLYLIENGINRGSKPGSQLLQASVHHHPIQTSVQNIVKGHAKNVDKGSKNLTLISIFGSHFEMAMCRSAVHKMHMFMHKTLFNPKHAKVLYLIEKDWKT